MYDSTFDRIAETLDSGAVGHGFSLLASFLDDSQKNHPNWQALVENLRAHRLHNMLLSDPFTAHGWSKPRGYAGDAALIDFMYNQRVPDGTDGFGQSLFRHTTAVLMADAARLRKEQATTMLKDAVAQGHSICALACGHWREADSLVGEFGSRCVAVDQDPISIGRIGQLHGESVETVEANVIRYLKRAADAGERFDLIYTLGLTDYFEMEVLNLFTRLAANCLTPGGRLLVANFVPNHPARGYMDACMDWRLILRSEEELGASALQAGLTHKAWRDETGLIAYCEMRSVRTPQVGSEHQ